ncbi:hydrolase [Sphingomicrobium astaxanthinifaciens]|uniref:hydrolase n=1 Tax=Sphingomicrobium astaxanthinifaciens TaxID=1227949 RepID=UPI001FCAEB98|nr:hydrolase [Sphingomicrobium astaxanthinifaciens]MCJ7420651.1 hydrolase [Sphingomicrobium astaxanthinifaciens]
MGSLSTQETAIVDAARSGHDEAFAQTRAWAEINSGSRNLDGLATVAGEIADAFAVLPGGLELVDPAPVSAVDAAGHEVALDHGRHLHLTVRPEAPVQLLFTGHMDTVFPVDHPFQSLTWLEEGKVLNGPGITDMKGGIAVMLAALKALEASPLAPAFGYEVVINSDEEIGSASSQPLLRQAAAGKRAAFTYEPSALPDGTLAGARAGSGNYSITLHGKSAHAGRNPRDGRNALVAAADLALQLKAAMDDSLTVNPARIDGGGPNNVVPDLAILRVNFRCTTLEDQARAERLVADTVASVARAHEVRPHIHGGFGRPPKPMTPAMETLFGLVKRAGADLDLEIGWKATGGVCDGNNIAATGIPVVDTMGVRGGAIHSPDEFLLVESIGERAALSALSIARLITP